MKLFYACAVLVLLSMHLGAAETNTVRVALVFDDGPFPDHTPKLLDLFAREKVRVSFSVVAKNVATNAATAKAIVTAGHELNNHSYSHRHAKDCTDAELEHEIGGAQKIITEVTGVTPKWYWPPFLEVDDRIRAEVAKAKLEVYSLKQVVVSQDYDRAVSAEEIKRKATTNVKDGSVILFHDWRVETYEQLPAILAELRRQGCVFLTFTELAEYNRTKK
ncbi:MAG TPA: polysaccharide deacetylase family protein [Verrucomicrobiae bacterium]|nr:polysaccharide deacetylase family protein [Verrucomicrobiae bacterium]